MVHLLSIGYPLDSGGDNLRGQIGWYQSKSFAANLTEYRTADMLVNTKSC